MTSRAFRESVTEDELDMPAIVRDTMWPDIKSGAIIGAKMDQYEKAVLGRFRRSLRQQHGKD
ncbi:MAG: hypothetical protein CMJ64_21160 [Planctomycetaceae bacterium]|nr:hypothetical protein [Planctomycetaceae bacterium]